MNEATLAGNSHIYYNHNTSKCAQVIREKEKDKLHNQTAEPPRHDHVSADESRSNFSRNTISNIVFFVFNALTSLIMVPYLRRYLGDANYGMTSLARQFTNYTAIITTIFASTVLRFVTVRLAKDDIEGARGYFNTQLITSFVMALALIPIVGAVSYYTPAFLRIPAGQETNTQILFALVYVSFILGLISNPFAVGQFVRQRFDIRNSIEMVNQICQYGTWIIMFAVLTPSIWHVGLGYSIGAVAVLIMTSASFRKCLPEIRPSLRGFDRAKFREMVKMGSWLMVSQVGVVLYLTIDLLIINRMLGPTVGGRYAYILFFALQMRTISSLMCTLVVPMAIANYARHDWSALVRMTARAVKFVSVGMAIPLGIFCGLAVPFLATWLGPDLKYLSVLVWLLLSHNVINSGIEPLFGINVASNRVAVPGMVTVAGGLFKVFLSIALVKYTSLGFYGVAIAGLIAFTLKNGIFTPLYAGRILNTSSKPFFVALIPSIFVFGAVAAVCLGLAHYLDLASYLKLIVTGTLVGGVAAVAIYRLTLNDDDRAFLMSAVSRRKGGAQ